MYYNGSTSQTIEEIAADACTDVIFAFIVPSGSGTSTSDLTLEAQGAWTNDIQGNVSTLQQAGKNVLISFGGDEGISSEQ